MWLMLYGAACAAIILPLRYRLRSDIRGVWRGLTRAERERIIRFDPEAQDLAHCWDEDVLDGIAS